MSAGLCHSAVAVAVALALTACGMADTYVTVKSALLETTLDPLKDRCALSVRVVDSRRNKEVVGSWCNLSKYKARNDVAGSVREALNAEFVRRGYLLEDSGIAVGVDVKKFFNFACTHTPDEARVELGIQVSGVDGASLYGKTIYGGHKLTPGFQQIHLMGTCAEEALELALSNSILRLFEDPEFPEALRKASSK